MTKSRVFRDPVHGLIALAGPDIALGAVLDTRAFQRLRRIRQDGFASLVYPGAEHSRFGHALGAFHVASRVTTALALAPTVARDVKVAALLHDIGHGPYSHAWEVALGGDSHERWGGRILAEDRELRGALAEVDPSLPGAIESFFAGTYRPRFARKLVSSQLDVDRMDYLLRDAHYTGVGYSAYDLDWIIHALRIARVDEGGGAADGEDDLVIDYRRGMHAVEQYLFGRFYMYAQVYYHKTVRAAEWMFTRTMERFADLARERREPPGLAAAARLARGETIGVDEYLSLDDARVWCAFEDWAREAGDRVLADLSARMVSRRLFKAIEAGDDPGRAKILAPRLAEAATKVMGEHAASYWAIDRAKRQGWSSKPGDELFVVGHPQHGTVDLGKLVQEMPIGQQVITLRVLCAPELVESFAAIVADGGVSMNDVGEA